MLDAVESHYRSLLDRHGENLGETCLTWCRAGSSHELAGLLGGDLRSAAPRTLSDADAESHQHIMQTGRGNTLLVGDLGSWFIVMEPGDLRASKSLDHLSINGEALSLVIGDTLLHYSLIYACKGRVLCRLRYLDDPAGDIGALEGNLADLPYLRGKSSNEWKVHALVLIERITGVRLTAEWLSREHSRYFCNHLGS
ncbi:hypothetical protein ABZ860_22460 [Microbispora sp. NPDC046973]|uniref:hypothetical protein n=1 Tax=Microbispora sp. NPDC046973 TaxID=3155022 RepID=UPI0033EF94FC